MKDITKNKRAYFDYEILEKMEAGLVLTGQEVKSVKTGRINLSGSYVVLKHSGETGSPELFLIGSHIPAYQPKNAPFGYRPERSRKLLLKKSEIKYLIGKTREKGLTLIPLRVYTVRGNIKLEFGLAKARKKFNKRELIKKREAKKEVERELKTRG